MQTNQLIKGKIYNFRMSAEGGTMQVTYLYETLNYWAFESETKTIYYIHRRKIETRITELEKNE